MNKDKKKTIATAAAGVVAGVAGAQGAQAAKEWYDHRNETTGNEAQANVGGHQDEPAPTPTPTPTPTPAPAPQPDPSNTDYSEITEVVPVDTGGTSEVADVVVEVPQEAIPGVDNVNPDEIAEAIILEPEQIIDDGILVAEAHETEMPEAIEELVDAEAVDEEDEEDDELLAEADEEEDSLDIDNI